MSIEELERVMQRALREEAFRELLQVSPDTALAEYRLSAEERAIILGSNSTRTAADREPAS